MDVNRLSQTLSFIRADEEDYKIQDKQNLLTQTLQNLTSNPGDTNFQVSLSSALRELSSAVDKMMEDYDPAKLNRITEIGAAPYFTGEMLSRINREISANAMSPATALDDLIKLRDQRKKFIDRVVETESGVDYFVDYSSNLEKGEAAVGFEIPRSLFDNEFKGFISELRVIQRIVRLFSEVETGSAQNIKLGTISTTDPLIFLQSPPLVVASIAASVSWLLSQWKKFEEIRKLRNETAKTGEFDKSELEEFFDKKITEKLDAAVKDRVDSLMLVSKLDQARKSELDSELAWALKALFARVERGMRVEVKVEMLPKKNEPTAEDLAEQEILVRVDGLANELSFPRIDSAPILALPRMSDGEAAGGKGRAKKPTVGPEGGDDS